MITDDQWNAVVSHVRARLEEVPSFEVDAQSFAQKFKLHADFQHDFLVRRDHPAPKLFEVKFLPQNAACPSGVIRFARQGLPST